MEKKLPLGWESDELDSLIAFVIGETGVRTLKKFLKKIIL